MSFLQSSLSKNLSLSLLFHGLLLSLIFILRSPHSPQTVLVDFVQNRPLLSVPAAAPVRPKLVPKILSSEKITTKARMEPEPTTPPAVPENANTAGPAAALPTNSGGAPGGSVYLGELRARIESLKQYPAVARNRGQTGKVEVGFTILKNGEITNVHLVSKTPFESLNNAALAAVNGVQKFKPIPAEAAREEWPLVIPIIFKM